MDLKDGMGPRRVAEGETTEERHSIYLPLICPTGQVLISGIDEPIYRIPPALAIEVAVSFCDAVVC